MANTTPPNTLCRYDCSFRTITETPGIWQCLTCQQLWDRPDRGIRVWKPEQQTSHQLLWAQALESGLYKQGREYLRRTDLKSGDNLYTCTGVAVDVCPHTSWSKGNYNSHAATSDYDLPNFLIPTLTVMNWTGLSSPQGHFKDLPQHPHLLSDRMAHNTLQHLNDSGKADFPTLAEIIRSNPKGMFI